LLFGLLSISSLRAPAADPAALPTIALPESNPLRDPNFFPIAVWLQDPKNAERYKAAGINVYVALWRGPTRDQLDALEKAGLRVICSQNTLGLQNKDNPTIIAWMHGDEPDNAQSLGQGKGYGPPILPEKIVRDYERIRTADPTRPVLLNLGQAVAWDNYIGRGVRRSHPEDYPEYVKGGDIVSFDIYPVVHENKEISGRLEYVARGVERLVRWAGGAKTVWNCIECTHISNPEKKATPEQVRAEVWMSLIHGSRGIIYFVHQFKPAFREAGLLDDPEMLSGVARINGEIQGLASVLNSPNVTQGVSVRSEPSTVPVAWMAKRRGAEIFVFAVCMRNEPVRARVHLGQVAQSAAAEVLSENRSIALDGGEFSDDFGPYAVHLYRIHGSAADKKE